MHRFPLALLLCAACTSAGDPGSGAGDDDDDDGTDVPAASVIWSAELAPSRHALLQLNEALFVMADDGGITALDNSSGSVLWEQPTDPVDVPFTMATEDDLVLFPDGALAQWFEVETGEPRNRYREDANSRGLVMAQTGNAYTVTYYDYVYDVGWAETHDEIRGRTSYVRYDTGNLFAPAVPTSGSTIMAGSSWVVKADPTFDNDVESEVVWRTDIGLSAGWAPVLANGLVVVGGTDGWVAAVDAETGTKAWTYRGSWPLAAEGIHVDEGEDLIVVPHANGELVVLELDTGAIRWSEDLPGDILGGATGDGGRVYAATDGGTLFVLDADDGDERAAVAVDGELTTRPLLIDGTVVLGSAEGTVFGIEEP